MRRSASILFLSPLLAQAVACAPDDAEIKGSWHVWLAANSSNTVDNDDIEEIDAKATRFECVRTWDQTKERWADGYVGPTEDEDWQSSQFVGGPCQANQVAGADTPDDTSDDEYELKNALLAEDEDETSYMEEYCTQDMMAKYVADCEPIGSATGSSGFLAEDGYYAMQGDLEPWRSEAIITGEGELQLAFHQRIQGEDWHLIWTIDPDFRPEACLSTEGGGAEIVPVHGSSWVEEWSADEDGHDIFYINAGAFHSPDGGDTLWYYPSDWTAGFGYSKFIGEEFLSVQPDVRRSLSQINEDEDGDGIPDYIDNDVNGIPDEQEQSVDIELAAAALDRAEWVENAGAYFGNEWQMDVKVEDNLWRPIDSIQSGLDGWTERNYSWVRIKSGSEVKVGGKVTGDFQVVLSGLESNSRMVVRGEFTIDELREDKWAYSFLEDDLRESEQGEKFCE